MAIQKVARAIIGGGHRHLIGVVGTRVGRSLKIRRRGKRQDTGTAVNGKLGFIRTGFGKGDGITQVSIGIIDIGYSLLIFCRIDRSRPTTTIRRNNRGIVDIIHGDGKGLGRGSIHPTVGRTPIIRNPEGNGGCAIFVVGWRISQVAVAGNGWARCKQC